MRGDVPCRSDGEVTSGHSLLSPAARATPPQPFSAANRHAVPGRRSCAGGDVADIRGGTPVAAALATIAQAAPPLAQAVLKYIQDCQWVPDPYKSSNALVLWADVIEHRGAIYRQ